MAHVLNINHTLWRVKSQMCTFVSFLFNIIFIAPAMAQLSDYERIQMIGQLQASC